MDNLKSWTMVDTLETLLGMIDELHTCSEQVPDIFLDLEGENLSITGRLCVLQILHLPKAHVYLVDCLALGEQAFDTCNKAQISLRGILESEIKKAIFDVRNDCAALFHQFEVSLHGVEDIQLMELVTRSGPKFLLSGLATCIRRDLVLEPAIRNRCLALKSEGHRLFDPKQGGSYTVFTKRPLSLEIVQYCVQDVCILPVIWDTYSRKMTGAHRNWMIVETDRRVQASKSPNFNGKGKHMALAPSMSISLARSKGKTQGLCLDGTMIANCLRVMSVTIEKPRQDAAVDASIVDLSNRFAQHQLTAARHTIHQ